LVIEIEGSEIPIMDGSCKFFVDLLEKTQVEEQDELEYFLNVNKTVRVEDGDSFAEFSPGEGFSIDLEIDFDNKVVSNQSYSYILSQQSFKDELSLARTFGFLEEVQYLQKKGYALGGSLTNSIVVSNSHIMNEGGLRYDDEFVRHKIVDIIGDMSLCGYRINGKFRGYKTGHSINNKLLRELFSNQDNFVLQPNIV
jgi:UDP-3-O-[3-hydroxymyristoyl] N-acetylglucosamine deacetylase